MPSTVFDPTTLTRFFNDAEGEFAVEFPCILDRISIDITSGVALYTISENIHSIKRITYKGLKLMPMPARIQRQTFQQATQTGKPYWYVFNNVGQNKLNLYPIPNETVAAGTEDLWGPTEIAARVIIEYYRVPDGVTFLIPPYFRRRLLKLYVAKQAFAIESRGQKLKNRDYFNIKWEAWKQMYANLLDELHSKPRKLVVSGGIGSQAFPRSPVLPINRYGISVETGE